MNHRAAGRILSLGTVVLLLCGAVLVLSVSLPTEQVHAAGPALDGIAHSSANLASALSVTLSTNNADVIVVLVGVNEAGGTATVSGVSSTHLTFHQRASGTGNSMYLAEWYAVGSSALNSEIIQISLTAASRFTVMVLAISGANTVTIFDGSPSIGPGGCCGTMSGSPYGTTHYTNTFSTTNPDDLILTYDASQGNPTYTASAPLTLGDQASVASWMSSTWAYTGVTAPQASQQYSVSTSVAENGITFVDAIMQSSSNTTTSTTSTSSQSGPLALDGTAHSSANLGSALSVSLTTSKSQDVVIVIVGINTAGGAASVQSVTSSHLTFQRRATGTGSPMYVEEWYSVASSPLNSEAITVALTGSTRFTVMALAISNANTAAIFDNGASTGPSGCCGAVGGSPYGTTQYTNTFSTSNADDLIIAYGASQGNPSYASNSPLTLGDQATVGSWMASAWGYAVVTTPQTGQQYSFAIAPGEGGITFVDAIMPASSATTSSTSTTSSSSTSSSTSSSSSSSSTTSTTTTTSTTLQAGSNRNYFIMDNGAYLQSVTVSMLLTNQLSGASSGANGGNWSLQLNAYAPNGFKAAITQYVLSYSGGVMFADAESYASNDLFLGEDVLPSASIVSSSLTTGTQVSITASTNSTGNVVGLSFTVIANNGGVLWTESQSLTGYPFVEAPMVGFETILVGYGGGSQSSATFTQANGVFLFKASTPLLWTATFPGSLSWVQYKNSGSAETSNLVYWTPQQEMSNVIAQSFAK